MAVFYLAILALMVWGVRFSKDGFHEDYIGKSQCNSIKGVFILVVFLRHIHLYIVESGYGMSKCMDVLFSKADKSIGQLLVVMFLLYSGYGIMESIKMKGTKYIDSMPKRRILTTLINFDIAVIIFIALNLIMGKPLDIINSVLSLTGWTSVGNSNWYIFVILLCYLLSYVSFKLIRNHNAAITIMTVLTILSVMVIAELKESWWYNTMLCYPVGMAYSLYKDKVERVWKSHYLPCLSLAAVVFLVFYNYRPFKIYFLDYNLAAICFGLCVVLLTAKISIRNKCLDWLGRNLFPLYIYQRLPMIALSGYLGNSFIAFHPYTYVILCFIITIAITMAYRFWRISL